VAHTVKLLRRPRQRVRWKHKCHSKMWGWDLWKRDALSRWWKTGKEGDDWMSNGNEFQRTDATTGNERRATADRWKGGTWSSCADDDRSRRQPGRSATRTSWHKYGGSRPCSTRNAMTATLKSTRSGRRNQCNVARASVMWSYTEVAELLKSTSGPVQAGGWPRISVFKSL